MARPVILNDTLMTQICDCIAIGMTVLRACAYCNISRDTYYQWKRIGIEKPDSVYGLFLHNIKQANAKSEYKLLTDLQNEVSWQSKCWLLERKWPKIWGKKSEVVIQPLSYMERIERESNIDPNKLTLEECRTLNDLYEKAKKDVVPNIEYNDFQDLDELDENEPDE